MAINETNNNDFVKSDLKHLRGNDRRSPRMTFAKRYNIKVAPPPPPIDSMCETKRESARNRATEGGKRFVQLDIGRAAATEEEKGATRDYPVKLNRTIKSKLDSHERGIFTLNKPRLPVALNKSKRELR